MKFQIILTSASHKNHNQQPHPEAFQEVFTFEQRESNSEFTPLRTREANWEYFRREGFGHRVADNGDFVRIRIEKRWFIEINSLDELVSLAKEAEKENPERGIVFDGETIEIYDSYRE